MEPNTLTPEETAAGWRLLFDGTSLDGWRGFRRAHVPSGWHVDEGTLAFDPGRGEGGDLITIDTFADFELRISWKISPGGNSGIFLRVSEDRTHTWETGPEFQVLDDERHADGASPLTQAGATYGLYPPTAHTVRPAGQWNDVHLRVVGPAVSYSLNGTPIVAYTLWSEEWEARVAGSKFSTMPGYGRNAIGHLSVQDHGDRVWYRGVKLRALS
ncbi:MAG: DUF1080 domain-containing protein [Bacteroidota bacterium]